jgi:hypothetical protein
LLQTIWHQQQGICALTGLPMVPGVNASIDHHIPQSKGVDNSPGNLRWILRAVNTAKSNLTDDELISLCRAIVKFADQSKKVEKNP